MDLAQWYAIFIAMIIAALLLYRIGLVSIVFLVKKIQRPTLKYLVYPLFIERRYWVGVTRLQAAFVGSYFIINGFCMGLGVQSTSDLIVRSGTMASINLIPLFLGGRTNVLANFLGISLHTYYLAHHWVGRLVIIEGLIHVVLVILSGQPWTFDSFQVSGIVSTSALALIFLLSVWFVRRLMFEFFLKVHFILAMVVIFALLKHLLPSGLRKSIFPIIAISLWGFNAAFRLARMAYHNVGGRKLYQSSQVGIKRFFVKRKGDIVSGAVITLQLRKPIRIRPGQYMYLFLSDRGFRRQMFQAHPYVITWWDDSMNARELSFLIQPQQGISMDLIARNTVRNVVIDGPYGKDLHLDKYETVIMIANGIGIAGIIPYARHIVYRRVSKNKNHEAYRRGLLTRKLDIFWILDDNCQQEWLSDWSVELQNKDPEKLILNFSCFYPNKKTQLPPVPENGHWRFIYQKDSLPIIEDLITKQIKRSPGKTIVAVCGNAELSSSIRAMTIKIIDQYQDVEFVETEFQPDGIWNANSKIDSLHKTGKDDIEMNNKDRIVSSGELQSQIRKVDSLTGISNANGERGLVKSHSGISNKLRTLNEENDESEEELDNGLEIFVEEMV